MNAQHRLRCMLALGYPPTWIAGQIGVTVIPNVSKHAADGDGLTDEQQARVHALADRGGEGVATTETCGHTSATINNARRRAQKAGYLPPMAFDQDDDGNDVNGDPTAFERTPRAASRTAERAALDRLDLLRHALLNPLIPLGELAVRLGIPENWERDLRPLRMSDLRWLASEVTVHNTQPWPDPILRRGILDVIAAAHLDGDYCRGWDLCVTLWANRYGTREQVAA